jgi:hypothetical protein
MMPGPSFPCIMYSSIYSLAYRNYIVTSTRKERKNKNILKVFGTVVLTYDLTYRPMDKNAFIRKFILKTNIDL